MKRYTFIDSGDRELCTPEDLDGEWVRFADVQREIEAIKRGYDTAHSAMQVERDQARATIREQSEVIIDLRKMINAMGNDRDRWKVRAEETGSHYVTREEFVTMSNHLNRLIDEFNKVARYFNGAVSIDHLT